MVVEEVGRQHLQSPITKTIEVTEESKKEDESVSHEVEVNLMSEEDKVSTIRDVLFSILESCEEIIKINEENKIMATTQTTSSKEKKKTGSPVTRSSSTAAKTKKERKEKKKDENVIYVIT